MIARNSLTVHPPNTSVSNGPYPDWIAIRLSRVPFKRLDKCEAILVDLSVRLQAAAGVVVFDQGVMQGHDISWPVLMTSPTT